MNIIFLNVASSGYSITQMPRYLNIALIRISLYLNIAVSEYSFVRISLYVNIALLETRLIRIPSFPLGTRVAARRGGEKKIIIFAIFCFRAFSAFLAQERAPGPQNLKLPPLPGGLVMRPPFFRNSWYSLRVPHPPPGSRARARARARGRMVFE